MGSPVAGVAEEGARGTRVEGAGSLCACRRIWGNISDAAIGQNIRRMEVIRQKKLNCEHGSNANKVREPRIRSAHIPADLSFCGQP